MLNFADTSRAPDGEPFQFTTLTNSAGSIATFMDWAQPGFHARSR